LSRVDENEEEPEVGLKPKLPSLPRTAIFKEKVGPFYALRVGPSYALSSTPWRGGDGALRRHQQLLRGEDLPAGPLRLRPRRQDRLPDHRLRYVDRRRWAAGRRASLPRQHWRSQDGSRPGRGPHEAVWSRARSAGWRSWYAHTNSDCCAQEAPGLGL